IRSVADVETQGTANILASDYDTAVKVAEDLLSELKTEEAQIALQVVIDRFRLIQGVRQYLIAEIAKEPFRWGWKLNAGQGEDILAADENGITIRSGTIPWKEVGLPRLSGIVAHYLSRPGVAPSTKGNHFIGLSFLCRLNSLTTVADQFEAKASDASPYAQEQIERQRP
ncbi:MAG: hypothetical protein O3C57_07650, partial [Verrucomicrobia bacterium]|nr:hypothetical protein [Verrucomicrobiota bacterium]